MSRPRKGPALPVPFGESRVRYQICATAGVCDSTLVKWALGDPRVSDHYARSMVLACAGLGIVPPPAAKIPAPIGDTRLPAHALRVVS